MSSNLRVNNILPSVGTNVAIGTAGGSITLTGGVTGSSIINTGVTTVSAGSTSAPSISPTGDSNTGIFFPSPDTVAIAEGGIEALRVDSSGRVGINSNSPNDYQVDISAPSDRPALRLYRQRNTAGGGLLDIRSDVGGVNTREFIFASGGDLTLSTGNLVIGTAGKGIDFSATANSSGTMTSELLSDYEEGTFTPTLTGASVAGTTTYTRQDGIYTKIGRQVTVSVFMQISNATGSGTIRLGGLPFTIGSYYSQGSVMVGGYNWSGGTYLNLVAPPTANYFDVYYSGDDIGWAIQSVVNESQDWLYTVTYNV